MKEFKLDNIKATGTTVGDVYYPKVKLHLPFDGSNGATSTTDSSNVNASITFQGSATIATAQSKFGGSSLHATNANPDGIAAQIVGTGLNLTADFTIEWWVRRVQVSLVDKWFLGLITERLPLLIRTIQWDCFADTFIIALHLLNLAYTLLAEVAAGTFPTEI